jgi:uncharacterized membrane protein YdfJ with MMPL/SSD domain
MAANYSSGSNTHIQKITAIALVAIAILATLLSTPIAPALIGSLGAAALWEPGTSPVRASSSKVNRRETVRGVLLTRKTNTGRIVTRWVPA